MLGLFARMYFAMSIGGMNLLGGAPPSSARTALLVTSMGAQDAPESGLAEQAAELALRLRHDIEDAEEELNVEVVHCKKFLCRGEGLRHDFVHSRPARKRALVRGALENEKALLAAMEAADESGLPREYMDEAISVANALAVARAEIEDDYMKLMGGDGTIPGRWAATD